MLPGLGDEKHDPANQIPLRMLLGAATVAMLLGTAGFLLWGLSSGSTSGAAGLFLVVLVLGAAVATLLGLPDLSVDGLRVIERLVFAAATLYLGWAAYRALEGLLTTGDLPAAIARWTFTLAQFVLLMVIYGTVVPNTWGRAARVIGLIALAPLAVAAWLWAGSSAGGAGLSALATPGRVTESLLILMVGAAVAVVTAYVSGQYLGLARTTRITLRYVLKRRIGLGGMGEVWLAEHSMLARPAAVKLIRADAVAKENPARANLLMRRFEREAQATARLRSAHTVEVYDYGVTDDRTFYYAMEYLDGIDLSTLVERHGPIPFQRVVYLLVQACESLADAHAQGLTHRDVKPANIFICRLGTAHDFVKVLDFGLVTRGSIATPHHEAATELTMEGGIGGTPAYMAPELVQGQGEADGRADIYALGCVGYYLLTGTPVFDGLPLSVLVEHVKTPPEPPSRRTDLPIPEELERVILRCLEKDPADRYQTAEEFAEALVESCPEPRWTPRRASEWWQLHLPREAA